MGRTETRAVCAITVSYSQGVSLDITDVDLGTLKIDLERVSVETNPSRDGTYIRLKWTAGWGFYFPCSFSSQYISEATILVRTEEQKTRWEQHFQEARESLLQARAPRDVEPPQAVPATS